MTPLPPLPATLAVRPAQFRSSLLLLALHTAFACAVTARPSEHRFERDADRCAMQSQESGAPSFRRADPPSPHAAHAVRLTSESVTLDGRLDEAVWSKAVPVENFVQKEPIEGAKPRERTEVRFCYDGSSLYIGARMHTRASGSVQSTLSRRDNAGNSERLLVSIDTYFDKLTAYTFGVTASGVRIDYYHHEDEEFSRDYSFDPVWEAAVTRDDNSWIAEMRIPFSQLRFSGSIAQTWGLNINRYIPTENEDLYWVLVPKKQTGWASRFGTLNGIRGIRSSYRIEIVPYLAGSSTLRDDRDHRDPFDDGKNLRGRAGLDYKMGLGPNLTLDASINPDFGQVEADPAEVNLSAYETIFSERRPFFVEGSQLLQGPGMSYFYSRRIGAAPHGGSAAHYTDMPTSTSILGAAKVTGRLRSGFSIGALSAVTSPEDVREYDTLSGQYTSRRVEPLAGFGVVRAQQQFGANASTAGLMFTGVQRDLRDSDPLAPLLNRHALAGGADFNLRFDGGAYVVSGYVGGSHVSGAPAALLRVQTSSAHYFQRPDAPHIRLDSNRTSLSGFCGMLQFAKNSGEHWLWGGQISTESPGFEINDAGLLLASDDIAGWGNLQYRETTPRTLLRSYSIDLAVGGGWNYGGIRQYADVEFSASTMLWNYWNAALRLEHGISALSDDLTRGGPLMGTPSVTSGNLTLSGNYAMPAQWSLALGLIRDDLGGWSVATSGKISYRPEGQWELSAEPRWSHSVNPRQYIAAIPGGTAATFGTRYVFSFIERGKLALTVRCNYAFTPDLTVELYAEPYAESGRFFGYGELAAARSRELRRYGTDGSTITRRDDGSFLVTDGPATFSLRNQDFRYLSFRSNLVMRWEWMRGSTLFLVWQQNRGAFESSDALIGPRDTFDSIGTRGTNFLALKVSYWLPVG